MEDTVGEPTHVAFADETSWNIGRYRGIALVTQQREDLARITQELQDILADSEVSEFKWENLRSARERFAALKTVKYAVQSAACGILRVDVLTWDIEDSRHKVVGRDDIGNLQRMYYHLFRNVLRARWPNDSTWELRPDEQTAIKWNELKEFLELASTQIELHRDLFTQGKFILRLTREFRVERITPCQSDEALIQMADLFAGLAAYSRSSYDCYEMWRRTCAPVRQARLFPLEQEAPTRLSGSDRERCQVLDKFNDLCKSRRMGVSLESHRGLKTFGPTNPINFWWYEPQHDEDKAPVRKPN